MLKRFQQLGLIKGYFRCLSDVIASLRLLPELSHIGGFGLNVGPTRIIDSGSDCESISVELKRRTVPVCQKFKGPFGTSFRQVRISSNGKKNMFTTPCPVNTREADDLAGTTALNESTMMTSKQARSVVQKILIESVAMRCVYWAGVLRVVVSLCLETGGRERSRP